MRGRRMLWFLVMIGLGALLGMVYGWVIHPLSANESTLKAMRYDYRADYVLMVAEVYVANGDAEEAALQLRQLSDQSPAQTAAEALQAARSLDWADADLEKLEALAQVVQGGQPVDQPTESPIEETTASTEAEDQP